MQEIWQGVEEGVLFRAMRNICQRNRLKKKIPFHSLPHHLNKKLYVMILEKAMKTLMTILISMMEKAMKTLMTMLILMMKAMKILMLILMFEVTAKFNSPNGKK